MNKISEWLMPLLPLALSSLTVSNYLYQPNQVVSQNANSLQVINNKINFSVNKFII